MAFQKVKAVLFDLDGTLLDTVRDIGAAANASLRRYGCPEHPVEAYRKYVGNGIRVLFRRAVPEGQDEKTYEAALAFYLGWYPEHCTERTELYPGVRELVDELAGRFRLGVFSNKTETTSRKIISHFFPEEPFRLVWGNNGERPLKPDPAAGALLCRELGLAPEEIAFVGDGDTDMEFASGAGFLPVACSWGYRSRDRLRAAGAMHIADSAEELRNLLL